MNEPGSKDESENRAVYHRRVLVIACAAVGLAFVLEQRDGDRVCLRGLSQVALPQTCMSRTWLGLKCPGCGLTRSIIHLAEGDWSGCWHAHRLGGLMAAVIAVQLPYRLLALRRPDRALIGPRWQSVLGYALITVLLGNWLVELAAGRLTSP